MQTRHLFHLFLLKASQELRGHNHLPSLTFKDFITKYHQEMFDFIKAANTAKAQQGAELFRPISKCLRKNMATFQIRIPVGSLRAPFEAPI